MNSSSWTWPGVQTLTTDHRRADLLKWKFSQVNVNVMQTSSWLTETCIIKWRTYNNLQNNWVMQTAFGSKCSRIIYSFLRIISTCNWFETIICLDFLSSLAVDHWTLNQPDRLFLLTWEIGIVVWQVAQKRDADFTEQTLNCLYGSINNNHQDGFSLCTHGNKHS